MCGSSEPRNCVTTILSTAPAATVQWATTLLPALYRHMMHSMARQGRDENGLARFGEPGMLVLLALSDGPKHGYAITADVLQQTGIQLGAGTLYGSLSKLVERGLVIALATEDRRRPYELTDSGRAALAAQLATWSRVVTTGRTRLSIA